VKEIATETRTTEPRVPLGRADGWVEVAAAVLTFLYLVQTYQHLPGGPAIVALWSAAVPGYALLRNRRGGRVSPVEAVALSISISLLLAWVTVMTPVGLLTLPRALATATLVLLLTRRPR